MTHEKLKAAFLQGGEHDSTDLFTELIRGSVRQAFWQMMSDEVKALRGPRYRPDSESELPESRIGARSRLSRRREGRHRPLPSSTQRERRSAA